jgi:Domain of unknown function (DUF892)
VRRHLSIFADGREVEDVDAVRDAGLMAAGQAAEHYEIARYGPWPPGRNSPVSTVRRSFSTKIWRKEG